jgi:hypothetical protein
MEADGESQNAEEMAGTSEKPKRKKDQYRRDKPWDVDGALHRPADGAAGLGSGRDMRMVLRRRAGCGLRSAT